MSIIEYRTDAEAQVARETDLVAQVVASFDDSPNSRLRDVLSSLTRHLHGFIRDIRLTEEEWQAGIDFLTRTGQITDDQRQEFILLSDVLGASMQTVAVNNAAYRDATEATVFGPFWIEASPLIPLGGDMANGMPGKPCWVEGTVVSTTGEPLAGARIEVWEADSDGLYDVQYGDGRVTGRAHLFSDEEGRYSFWGTLPTAYPIPSDGPVGELLAAVGRNPMRAAHLHFMVSAPHHRTLITHIFVEGDPGIDTDTVFGVKPSLIMPFTHHEATEATPDGRIVGPDGWSRVTFDIVLASQE